ncbi:putative transcriptional regulator [Streptomyces bingchenggensis BCW-1]|uniref:Putative transcriptional regulator n=1 Tax=Streptomyces bingchenggensis (strain BCW-1) TaxID=749414 RepID=D7BW93_STRBB|nr:MULTISPECIES: TetR/AcrR family transcriptional regulator [Streptomyces]ADI11803.1 putative transcriptional regulator [Streptomyces bingchenggensis BCW-1]
MEAPQHEERRTQVRGAKFRALVLDATIARIAEAGIDHVRFADVADKAGVHEASLYRRWKTVPRLLIDALLTRTQAEVPIPDTGSVRRDLKMFTTDLARFAQTPIGTALIRFTVASDNAPDIESSRREFWMQRLSAAEEIIERGKKRGEVDPGADARLVVLTLGGLIHLHVTHLGTGIPTTLPGQAVALILPGITPS